MRLPLIAAAFYNVFLAKMNALLPERGVRAACLNCYPAACQDRQKC